VVGIGAADAHEFHLMGLKFAPYEVMFQMARTHVLVPSDQLTDDAVYDALRSGHAYFSIELMARSDGFTFVAERGQKIYGIMGDEVTLIPNLQLTAWLPSPARLDLYRDGTRIRTLEEGQLWHFPIDEPGVYRIEASRHGKPWIFSNPIYVREQAVLPTTDVIEPSEDESGGVESNEPAVPDAP